MKVFGAQTFPGLLLIATLGCSDAQTLDLGVSLDAGDNPQDLSVSMDAQTPDQGRTPDLGAPRDLGVEDTGEPALEVVEIAPLPGGVHGATMDDDGVLYYSDTFANANLVARVYRLAPPYDGIPEALPIDPRQPSGLTILDGDLIVSDTGGEVVRYTLPELQVVQRWSALSPWNTKLAPDGSLLSVAFQGEVQALEMNGQARTLFGGLDAPFDLFPVEEGIWVTEQVFDGNLPGKVNLWAPQGQILRTIEYGWSNPEGIAVDTEGNVWIAETALGEVIRVSPSGALERIIPDADVPVVITVVPQGVLVTMANFSPRAVLIRAMQ